MKQTLFATTLITLLANAPLAVAQDITNAAFTSENAILDTSIAFVADAREQQQNLRGAFGWATFQEGFVHNVFFRFDPDGYARFSPSDRLEGDVFEVTCLAGTTTCMAQKGDMSLHLAGDGRVQIIFANMLETDQVMVFDGAQHTRLPAGIFEPLNPQIEQTLGSGGALEIYRGDMLAHKVSLKGFTATAAYLRWISSGQNNGALPTDLQPTVAQETEAQQRNDSNSTPVENTAEDTLDPQLVSLATTIPTPVVIPQTVPTAAASPLTQIEVQLGQLMAEIAALKNAMNAPVPTPVPQAQPARFPTLPAETPWRTPANRLLSEDKHMAPDALPDEVRHLQYLVSEMGMAPKTALVMMQFMRPTAAAGDIPDELTKTYHDSLAASILGDLEADLDFSLSQLSVNTTKRQAVVADEAPATNILPPPTSTEGMFVQDNVKAGPVESIAEPVQAVAADPKPEPAVPAATIPKSDVFQPLADYLSVALETSR